MNALRSTDHALLTESEYHGLFSRIRRYADANRFHAMMKGVADDWSSAMYLFLHPEASFYAEDGKWTGMCDENFCQWHEIMIHDLYIAVYEMSENELQNLFDHGCEELCYGFHTDTDRKKKVLSPNSITSYAGLNQYNEIPTSFSQTLWKDLVDYCESLVLIRLSGFDLPDLGFSVQMVQDFLMDEHQKLIDTYDPYDPVGEILKKWDPEHNFYWDVDDGTHFPAYQSQFSVRWDSVLEGEFGKRKLSLPAIRRGVCADIASFLENPKKTRHLEPATREAVGKYLQLEPIISMMCHRVEKMLIAYHQKHMKEDISAGRDGCPEPSFDEKEKFEGVVACA